MLLFYFVSFYLLLFMLLWLLFACCVWRVCVPLFLFFFLFLFLVLHFILPLLIHVKNHFSLAIIVYIIIVILTTILFFSMLPVCGGEFSNCIRAAWSTPTHWLLWVSHRVGIILTFILFYYFFFFVSYSLVTTVEVLAPSFIFIIWHQLIMMPRGQGM